MLEVGDRVFHEFLEFFSNGEVTEVGDMYMWVQWPGKPRPYLHNPSYILKYKEEVVAYSPTQTGDRDDDV